jgi:N-glycosylase/DNA lyase
MEILEEKLKLYTKNNALKIEESDLQFIALKNMYDKLKNKDLYLAFIIVNSVICYQLSST